MKQLDRQMHELQKEIVEARKERQAMRLLPCRGDSEIRQKEARLEEIDRRVERIQQRLLELSKRRRELMSEVVRQANYESPCS